MWWRGGGAHALSLSYIIMFVGGLQSLAIHIITPMFLLLFLSLSLVLFKMTVKVQVARTHAQFLQLHVATGLP